METHRIYINHMLALCHMYKEYELFKNDLENKLTNSCYGFCLANKLNSISHGEFVFNSKEEKYFYKKHKFVIDTINEFTSIQSFIKINYDDYGRLEPYSSLNYFYNYILENEDSLDKIISLLESLKKLGFNKFDFCGVGRGFHHLVKNYDENITVVYLDNMEAIPTANKREVLYKSDDPSYEITIESIGGKDKTTIKLNNLMFDSKRLPSCVSRMYLFNKIMDLEKLIPEEQNIISNSIILGDSINYLLFVYQYVIEKANEISDEKTKSELLLILNELDEKINKLKLISNTYNTELQKDYDDIYLHNLIEEAHSLTRINKLRERGIK